MNIELFKSLTKKAKNILISTHVHPDADGIGSQMALKMALEELGKNVICVNQNSINKKYKHLDKDGVILSYKQFLKSDFNDSIELFIVTDANSLSRIGPDIEELVKKAKNLLFIDHHPCPHELSALHCINTNVAATGELVGTLIEELGIKFTQETAHLLYTAILIDTNSFRYPTVTGETHRLIGKLLDTGIKPTIAYNQIYGTKKITHMQLLGTILSLAKTTKDQSIAWFILDEALMKKFNVDPEDTHNFINHLLVLENVKVACLFRQTGEYVKISLRSTGDHNVGAIAQALGGGGHHHAAAAVMKGTLKSITTDVVQKLKLILSE